MINEELYHHILNSTDEEKQRLIIDNFNDISNEQLSEFMQTMDFMKFLELCNELEDKYNFNDETFKYIFMEYIEQNGISLLEKNSKELTEYGIFDNIVSSVAKSLSKVIEAIKRGISKDVFLLEMDKTLFYEYEELTEADKKICLDNFDVYMPSLLLSVFEVENIEDIDEKRLEVIKNLDNSDLLKYVITCLNDEKFIIKAINSSKGKLTEANISEIILQSDCKRDEIVNGCLPSLQYETLNTIAQGLTHEEKVLFQQEQIFAMMEEVRDFENVKDRDKMQDRLENFSMILLATELGEIGVSLEDVDVEIVINDKIGRKGEHIRNFSIDEETGQIIRSSSYSFNLYDNFINLENKDASKRVLAIKDLATTIFHEVRHHRQALMTEQYYGNKKAVEYAREKILHE